MFSVGAASSSSGSEPSSRDASPSKVSERSTTSEAQIESKTPQRYASFSEADWSDHSDTPVKPRTLRRTGRLFSNELIVQKALLSASDSGSDDESEGFIKSTSDEPSESIEDLSHPFPNATSWEPQYDDKDIDPLKLGEIPVAPLPLIAIHSSFHSAREAWGLPPLRMRCPHDSRRHPFHIYKWDTKKLNCYDTHEPECQLCGAACCSVQAYTKAINEDPRPNPLVPLKYRNAFQRDIDEINAVKPHATDPFERMLKCGICFRNVCPDCAGRCMKPACLRVICKSCGDPDPWVHCQCEMKDGKMKISYL